MTNRDRAVKNAVDHAYTLRLRANDEWLDRATIAAAQAIRPLPADASDEEIQAAARSSVAEIQSAFEQSERLDQHRNAINTIVALVPLHLQVEGATRRKARKRKAAATNSTRRTPDSSFQY